MTAAAMLARLGNRVLVLEQHFVPGGFTQTLGRGPYSWHIGVHAVGEVTADTPAGRFLDDLTPGRLSVGWEFDKRLAGDADQPHC